MPPLNPNGNPVRVGNVTLRTPGLAGEARALPPNLPETRSAEGTTEDLDRALADAGVIPQETVEIAAPREVGVPAGAAVRSTSHGEDALEVTVPDAGEDWGQFLLAADESGVITWNFPVDAQNRLDVTRGGATRTYVVRRFVAPTEGVPETRGLLGAAGKKILKVLAFRLLDPIGERVGDYFVSRWEKKKRPYRFRSFLPESYSSPDVPDLGPDDWARLSSGRALLMVHGTNSRTHVAFSALPLETVRTLHERYQGRVFAFDHLTLSEDPRQNVQWFFENVPDGTRLDVDVVCHSRGGLVARTLAERESEFSLGSRDLAIQKVVFVAVPNAGTILADAKYMSDFLDTYTNLLNFLPDNGVTEAFEGLVTVAKQLAVGTLKGLDGLQSMRPGGPFLEALNRGDRDAKRYFALTSHYEPTVPGWKAWATDRLLDKIFQAENDLVVPTLGVYDKNGSGFFPIEDRDRITFGEGDGIAHTRFFGEPRVRERILGWLG
jgi:pimeloyl-ACP methyl ester carboxylesterase